MRFPDIERRRRLVRRHHHGRTAVSGLEAVRDVVAFHSSDPVTPHLGMWARVPNFTTSHLDRLISEERSLWRVHAMRRTLFLVATDEGGVILAAASLDIARKERARLEEWLGAAMGEDAAAAWLDAAAARVQEVLEQGGEWRAQELSAAVPDLDRKIAVGSGRWATEVAVSSRLLYWMAMEGHIVRTLPAGSWRSSQYRWAVASRWWDNPPRPTTDAAEARGSLAGRYLATHGPATLADLRWWTGWTARNSRAALDAVGAVAVDLEDGTEAYVLASDLEPQGEPDSPAVAFLPGLDPSPMGWKDRDWYLGPHAGSLFDRNGNAGPTVWADGRVVGGWGQRPDGTVVHELLDEVEADTAELIDEEARALGAWLDGDVVSVRFKTPLERRLAEG